MLETFSVYISCGTINFNLGIHTPPPRLGYDALVILTHFIRRLGF